MKISKTLVATALSVTLAACGGSDSTDTTPTTPTPPPTPPTPTPTTGLEAAFPKYTSVFGVQVRATFQVPDEKMLHAAKIMAKYLDNNDDGIADNQQVVERLNARKATLIMAKDEAELGSLESKIGDGVDMDALQDLQASETIPNGAASGQFDGSLEEVLHLITHVGYSAVYPKVFGEKVDSLIADAMDKARGGRFDKVPASYPEGAWYTYDDETCDYSCMVTEYTYWALTSMLGGQEFAGRLEAIQNEWRLNTREKVRTGDPDVYAILTNQSYILPTVLPDGNYTSSTFEIKTSSPAPTPSPGEGSDNSLLQAALAGNPNHKIAFTNGSKVMMMSADGSNLTELADGSPIAGYVSWGPDAKYVYFASAKGEKGSAWEAFRVDVNTKQLTQLSKFGHDVRSLGVSPDGKHLAVSIMSANSNIDNNNDDLSRFHTDLFIVEMSDAEAIWERGEFLTRANMKPFVASPAAEQLWYEELNWSPKLGDDGLAVLAYTKTYRYDDDANSYTHAYTIKADGSAMTKIADNKDQPIFSIDGNKLTFIDNSYYDFTDKAFKKLVVTGIKDEVASPAISPDDNFIVFEVGDENRRLGMARASDDANNQGVLIGNINGYEPRWSPKEVVLDESHQPKVIGAASENACKQVASACFIIQQNEAHMYGVIGEGIVKKITELTANYPAVKTIIMMNVPGSEDDESNLTAAKMVYDKGLNTAVTSTSMIASGGVDFFLAGNKRTLAEGAKLGVHSWGGDDGLVATELPRDHAEHKPYIAFYEHIKLAEPAEFYFFTLNAAPASSIHFMTQDELVKWKIAR